MAKINYSDTVREIRNETGFGVSDLREVMEAIDVVSIRHLKQGDSIKITPSITLSVNRTPEREMFNIGTKDVRVVPAHNIAKASFTESFKDSIK